MAFSSTTTGVSASPNVTPLIDVLLVLLIIFMVITPMNPVGLAGQLPVPSTTAADSGTPFSIRVLGPLQAGSPARYLLNGHPVEVDHLLSRVVSEKARSTTTTAWIEGESSVDYHAVVAAVDAAHSAGFSQVGLVPRGGR